MIECGEAKDLIRDVFEEEALVIGGLLALHNVDDELVWRLVRSLDAIRLKALRRVDESLPEVPDEPRLDQGRIMRHPAIEDFLLKLSRDRA